MPRLTPAEREVLVSGLRQWGGPIWLDGAAKRIGYQTPTELHDRAAELARRLVHDDGVRLDDLVEALWLVEVAFISDRYGAGVEWETVTGFTDTETIEVLRSLQRKLVTSW